MASDKKRFQMMSFILIIGLIVMVAAIIYSPKKVDWRPSYSKRHSLPLGMDLVFKVSEKLFPGKDLVVVHRGVADFFGEELPSNSNFLLVNDLLEIEQKDWSKLMPAVEAGNMVLMAADRFSPTLVDSLGIDIRYAEPLPLEILSDSVGFNFANRRLKVAGNFWYSQAVTNNRFVHYDSLRTTVLGYNNKGATNYIRVKHGQGFFYINCNPIVFTNYHLLDRSNSDYIFRALSYLPVATTYWDEKYKSGAPALVSEMGYILNNRELRIAWYLFLSGVILYFVFQGKRKQRPILVINSPSNSSLDFVESVARLYYINGDHLNIAKKRYLYFLDFLRSKLFLDTSLHESRLIEECSRKSGVPERTFASIFRMARNMDKVDKITLEDLHQFNRQLEFFYKNCN